MATKKGNIVKVGFFIFFAFSLLIIAILIIGREKDLFKQNVKINTVFRDVKGLKVGNRVRFTGLDIGMVVNLTIVADTAVMVELAVKEDILPYIKKNSVATIGSEGLMGNKTVIILPGSPGYPSVIIGDMLPSIEPVEIDDIMVEIKRSSEKISVISDNLIEITDKVNQGRGLFGKIFTDDEFYRNLEKTSRNIMEVSQKATEGQGILYKLFSDTVFAMQLDTASENFKEISHNFEEITEKINRGEGVFGRLFTDTAITSNLYKSSKNLARVTDNLLDVSVKLNDDKNALSKLIADTAFADSLEILLYRLNTGITEATEASEAIQRSGLIRMFSKKEKADKKPDNNPDSESEED